jgi:hypothetical protein
VKEGQFPRRLNSRNRLENALQAHPADTIRVINWDARFERGANGWTVLVGYDQNQI